MDMKYFFLFLDTRFEIKIQFAHFWNFLKFLFLITFIYVF